MASSSGFTDDILIEIFAFLPLNSIYKFKCLSKVWLSNLSGPNFITKWFKINSKSLPWIQYHSLTNPGCNETPLRFRKAYHESHSDFMSRNDHLFSFKFLISKIPFQVARLYLLGSSNGLVLCWSTDYRYHVCNPLTKTWATLPSAPRARANPFQINGISCEYSPSLASYHYKVVCILVSGTPPWKFIVDVFSSDLGVWESIEVLCDGNVEWERSRFDNPVILNGVLYWIDGGDRLFVYNLNQNNGSGRHRSSLINLPDGEFGRHATDYDSFLGESEGQVCYARTRTTGKGLTVTVWVLNEVDWRILHNDISIDSVWAELRSRMADAASIQVVGFSPADRNVVLLGWRHWVWGFNIQTRRVEDLCLDNRHRYDMGVMYLPFVLKPMPTVLPPPSLITNLCISN